MPLPSLLRRPFAQVLLLCFATLFMVAGAHAQAVSFNSSGLSNVNLGNPTSLQFGPDGRLYVSQQNGQIKAFTVERTGSNDYEATGTETIDLVQDIPNYNDDGTVASGTNDRQVTGILVTGTGASPVLYVSSSDPRIGAGSSGSDSNLDTNSGIISKLTFNGAGWDIVHLVRGLPRSEENHATNGLQLDEANNVLLVAQGGHTNAGAPSNNFALTTEYALAAALLEIDLTAIEALPTKTDAYGQDYKYDLPTLDDPDRANEADGSDPGDPFGGNDGLNQAKLVEGGPVQIYSGGYRNPYDLVLTEGGKLYTVDNGANGGWGGLPDGEGTINCTNDYLDNEPGSTSGNPYNGVSVNNQDNLHYVPERGFYAGHPTPVRGNPEGAGLYVNGTFRDGSDPNNPLPADWPAVAPSLANPEECDFRLPGNGDGALHTWGRSTNGIAEYTATNFGGVMQGNLLTAGFNGTIDRVELNAAGDAATNVSDFASGFGSKPLDVIAQGDDDPFGGTVWAATYGANNITIFEPSDYDGIDPGSCTAADDPALDEDNDGYSNADELDNGTNPCSGASKPNDFDMDLISDLNDGDDDNDGLSDAEDPFVLDADNGLATSLPVEYDLFNATGIGFGGIGFTGLMTNGSDYLELLDPDDDLILGGTSGLYTDPSVGEGDTYQGTNTQANAFQFGIDVDQGTAPFTIEAQVNGPFNGVGGNYASQGLYIGPGDQDNYLKVVLNDGDGNGGIQVLKEVGGSAQDDVSTPIDGILDAGNVKLYLSVDPAASTVQAKYAADGGPVTNLGSPVSIPAAWLSSGDAQGLAVGFIATSTGPADEFAATWDYVNVTLDPVTAEGMWASVAPFDEERHENAFVQAGNQFYLLGGRESQNVEIYNPSTEQWTTGAAAPTVLNHFQAVEMDGLIYAGMAFDDNNFPNETPAEHLYLYDPAGDAWITGPEIPEDRRRGSAGAFARDGQIYFVSGIQDGHSSGHVTWFDAYDPATNTWSQLPDAPHARDHFFANYDESSDKLYMIGGRTSGTDGVFLGTVEEVDVYDFATGSWSTLPAGSNIPTERAAAVTGMIGDEIVVAGGEREAGSANAATEAFNVSTGSWRTLTDMTTPRHGTQGIVSNGGLYVAGGSPTRGGPGGASPDLEAFYFFGETNPTGAALAASTLDAPASLALGAAAVGNKATQTLTLSNTGGNQALVLESLAFTGGSSEFLLGSPFDGPVVIAPGASRALDVTFQPEDLGAETATLTATYGGGQTANIALSGEGADAPEALVRINAGGGSFTDADGNVYAADESFTGGIAWPANGPKAAEAIAGTENDVLYQTERSAGQNLGSFAYAIPVPQAGTYTINLHFAEIYFGASASPSGPDGAGQRVFSVDIEDGQSGLSGYDINADVGSTTAVVKTFEVEVTDGTLDLAFSASANQPKIAAIEVLGGSAGGNQPPQVAAISNQSSIEGDDVSNAGLAVSATDPDGGPQNLAYSISGQPAGVDIEPTNGQLIGAIAEGAAAGSPYDVTVTVTDGAASASVSFAWTVSTDGGTTAPVAGEALYRVNAGGASYTDAQGNTYAADAASSYFSGGDTYGSAGSPAIAGTDDEALYQTERYGGGNNVDPFTYSFAVPNGSYDVALHFAEVFQGVSASGGCPVGGDCTGQRVFTVEAEGQVVLSDYDIYAAAGASATAVVEALRGIEVTDGTLDLSFSLGASGVDQAKVSALSVFPASTGDNEAPAIAAITDQVSAEGESVSLQVDATDPEGGALSYSAASLPAGLSIDAATGLISGTVAADGPGGAFVEEDGLVMIEAESGNAPANWAAETALSGFTGDGYLRFDGSNHFGNPGIDVIEYQVEIQTPGTYQFQWRSQTGVDAEGSTEHNDSWLKIDADAFYGEDGSGIVCPKGYDPSQNDCSGGVPEGGGSGGWFKAYLSGTTNWTWTTKTSDNDPHDIFARFDEAGTYTIQVSGRSTEHVIDRMVLHHVSEHSGDATSTQIAESVQSGGGAAAGSPYAVSVTATDDGMLPASATETFQWTVTPGDGTTVAPAIAITAPTGGAVIAGDEVTVNWTTAGNAPNDHVHVTLDDNDYIGGQALDGSYTFSGLSAGTHTIAVQVAEMDHTLYTNPEASTQVSFTVDPNSTQTVVARINAGGDVYTDAEGKAYEADAANGYFSGGQAWPPNGPKAAEAIAGTEDDALYQTERSAGEDLGSFAYAIPVPQPGTYTVSLHFAEIYHGASASPSGGLGPDGPGGERVFSVDIEDGQSGLSAYDINADVGPVTATVKTFQVEVTDGTLDLGFSASVNRPKVSAIEVLGSTEPPAALASALVKVTPGADLFASTYGANSFQIENTGEVAITDVSFDLSTSLLPDVVFDPVGTAGDNGAKCLEANSGADATGFAAPADACTDPFSQPHNGTDADEGYDVLSASFGDFGAGESFGFAVDIDPTSIKGDQSTGDAGSISGFELTGSTVTVTFADGTTQVTSLYDEGSAGGGQALAAADAPAAPSIAAQGATAPATVAEAAQTITVTGTPGATVSLLRADARLYIDAGSPDGGVGYDVDAFEANEVLAKELYTATIGEDGTASIDVTLTQTESPNAGPNAGLNHFVAVVQGDGAQTSQTSNVLVLELGDVPSGDAALAGLVSYYDDRALEGASVVLTGAGGQDVASATSDASGAFSLAAEAGQSYQLAASGPALASGEAPASGLSTTDLVAVRSHLLGIAPIEAPEQVLAADANASGAVSTTDVTAMRQLLLGLSQGFSDAEDGGLWQCIVAGSASSEDPFGYESAYGYDPLTGEGAAGQDFTCLKRGDVNGSWQPSSGQPSAPAAALASAASAQRAGGQGTGAKDAPAAVAYSSLANETDGPALRLAAKAPEASPGEEIVVPVVAEGGFRDIGGVQFTLEWDAGALEFAGLESSALEGFGGQHANLRRAGEGLLTVVWDHPEAAGQTLSDDASLLSVRFRVRAEDGEAARVAFSSRVTALGAHRGATLGQVAVRAAAAEVSVAELPEDFALSGNYPNPFSRSTKIAFDLPQRAEVSLEVYDVLGRRVMSLPARQMQAGAGRTIRLDASRLGSGVYLYRVTAQSEEGVQTSTGRLTVVR